MSENREQVFENEEFEVLLRKYEDMRSGSQSIFFDVEEFEQIIDYYLDDFQYDEAREAAKLAQHCLFPDSQILFDDVRQTRKHRWWLTTTISVLLIGALAGLGVWIYGVGESIGATNTRIEFMQRAATADRVEIVRNSTTLRSLERGNSERYTLIRESLARIESRLENIEQRTKGRR